MRLGSIFPAPFASLVTAAQLVVPWSMRFLDVARSETNHDIKVEREGAEFGEVEAVEVIF